jgi:flagellar assembly protein FliH
MSKPIPSKIIPGESLNDCSNWVQPAVAGNRGPGGRNGLVTAKQLEVIQQEAYDEGFAQGLQEGRAAGRAELHASVAHLNALMRTLSRPLEQLDRQVEEELVSLAIAITRQLVRREIKTDPMQIIGVVREALAVLPVASRQVQLHLHPEDAGLIRETLSPGEGEQAWRIVEDPMQGRGGCRVVSEQSRIDASVEARLTALIAKVLGGEREKDKA